MEHDVDAGGTLIGAKRSQESFTIPVIEEQLVVSRREAVTDTVLLRKSVHAHEQLVEIPLVSRKFEIERVAMERVVDAAPPVRTDGDTTVYSIVEERLVKQFVVVEEIRVTVVQTQTLESKVVTLSREEVAVEHVASDSDE